MGSNVPTPKAPNTFRHVKSARLLPANRYNRTPARSIFGSSAGFRLHFKPADVDFNQTAKPTNRRPEQTPMITTIVTISMISLFLWILYQLLQVAAEGLPSNPAD